MSAVRKNSYSVTEAQPELAARAKVGEAITLTSDGQPVAQIVPFRPPRVGSMRGTIRVLGDVLASTAHECPDLP